MGLYRDAFISLVLFLILLNDSVTHTHAQGIPCSITLPQKSNQSCTTERQNGINKARIFYELTEPTSSSTIPFPQINKSFIQIYQAVLSDPINGPWFLQYYKMGQNNKKLTEEFLKKYLANPYDATDVAEFKAIYDLWITENTKNPYVKYPSQDYNTSFRDPYDNQGKDSFFADQRLAGLNPMLLARVSTDSFSGVPWRDLKNQLNPDFDWEKAIENTVGESVSLERVIKDGHLFVLQYPLKKNIPTMPDIVEDKHPLRTMRDSTSPIALFLSKIGKTQSETRLLPLAIQLDNKQESMVYTPGDGALWEEAKLSVQSTDLSHAQIIEHLLKTHIILEPMCVVMYRHFSNLHPLHEILKFHCRGVIMTNSYGFPVLMADQANMHRLFAIGNKGSMRMLINGYNKMTWDDFDFEGDIKRRGVDDMKALPYYPYRDDGKAIMDTLTKYVQEYVNLYYESDKDVQDDTELQGFANEISASGTGPTGGKGKFKKFPKKILTIAQLENVIARMIWISTVGHSVANYPVAVYGAMTFNMPTKLYDDPRTYPGESSVYSLPNIPTSVFQVNLAMGLGSLHFDSLLDYFYFLQDPKAKEVTKKYFGVLRSYVEPILRGRNMRRFAEGRISYPFMLPSYIGNSIHT